MIVLRDLDHYCFGIQLVVLEILVELFEFQCIGYVTLIKPGFCHYVGADAFRWLMALSTTYGRATW